MLSNRYFSICLYGLGVLFATSRVSVAQVTPDNTVGTQVNSNGNVSEITGGQTRGNNLFHSFQDFSVPTNNEAFFNNNNDVSNILSRVTGGNVSNIDGLIRANDASLFLINPAGIMFGENASLNLGGSFYGTTADSILFEDGEFSASDLDNPPLLTINAPIGFNFRNEPGDITSSQATLVVNNGQDLFLIGGNLNFDGGTIGTLGGRVELGALAGAGKITLDEDGNLDFSQAVARGNISLSNSATIFVSGEEGGSVDINAKNLSITSNSIIFAGINVDSGSTEAQAGDVVINLTEDLVVDNSDISNNNFGTGNAGNVVINARNVSFFNGGNITGFNIGAGNIGNVSITATGDIVFDGVASPRFSGINNFFDDAATGNVGEINLTAQNIDLTNGGSISSIVSSNNNSGNINLDVADTIRIDGSGTATFSDGTSSPLSSSINSNVAGGNGNSGNINISTQNLLLNDGGFISATNSGTGNSGDINVNVDVLSITEAARITGDINGAGNGSNITINATDSVSVIGNAELFSDISADINSGATGEAGNIEINTNRLALQDAFVSANVAGDGEGGSITINAIDSVSIVGDAESFSFIAADINTGATGEAGNIEINTSRLVLEDAFVSADVIGDGEGGAIAISAADSIELSNLSLIQANVVEGSTGNGGNINIQTEQLNLSDGSQISASTSGSGNAGNVTIDATESVTLSGVNEVSRGGIFANALINDGKGGNVNLTTGELTIADGAIITAGNFSSFGVEGGGAAPGTGEPGNITIAAESLRLSGEGRIEAITQAKTGQGANIDLQIADTIFLTGDSFISAEARGNANGGNLNIDTDFIVAFDGNNDIIASAERGTGGNINITVESLLGIKERFLSPTSNDINASSEFGIDGNVSIGVLDLNSFEGVTELSTTVVEVEETVAQICDANRLTAQNSLVVKGKGGISPNPDLPLNSDNIIGQSDSTSYDIPQPIKTSRGNIQPAMGIKVTESGIVLTAYKTDNKGNRLPNIDPSCGVR